MNTLGWNIVVVVLAWYPAGLILVGIGNRLFEGPDVSAASRRETYQIACLGPFIAIFILIIGLKESYYYIQGFLKIGGNKVLGMVIGVTDWIAVGFRKPPARTTTDIQPVSHPELSWPQDLR